VIRFCQRPVDISSSPDLRLAQGSEIICKSERKYFPAVDRCFEMRVPHPRDVFVARVGAGRLGINPPTRPSDLGDRGREGRIHPVSPGLSPPKSGSAARSNHWSTRCVTPTDVSAPGIAVSVPTHGRRIGPRRVHRSAHISSCPVRIDSRPHAHRVSVIAISHHRRWCIRWRVVRHGSVSHWRSVGHRRRISHRWRSLWLLLRRIRLLGV
jgi:hypothetical protein